jgi:argininosuccinate lyase
VGALVRRSVAGEAARAELVASDPALGPEAAALVAPGVAVGRRTTSGGAGPDAVAEQLSRYRTAVATLRARVVAVTT